uniref:F-box domain-containing protein n=1 Tax=Amblyomma maculatum TaxID=34609 RepID=G3MNC4_AMBMU
MNCAETMTEALSEMGDPDKLANSEGLVILKLDKPLPSAGRLVPRQLMVDANNTRLTTDREGFVACRSFLVKHTFSTVLFAGMPELRSVRSFLSAAKDVLYKTPTLITVHNRDRVADLAAWFPYVTTLVLFHDLKLQTEDAARLREMAQVSHLQKLCGTTPGVGADELFLCPLTLTTLLANCPGLSAVQAPMDEIVTLAEQFRLQSPVPPPLLGNCRELTLGCNVRRRNGNATMIGNVNSACMEKALEQYPDLEQLQVTTTSKKVLGRVPLFSHLTRLSLMFAAQGQLCPFDPHISRTLRALSLTHLSLKYFEGVCLSVISESCPNLESLSLSGCNIAEEKISAGTFPKLTSLCLGDSVSDDTFFTFLEVVADLTELYLDGEWVVSAYLGGPVNSPRPLHRRMQRLTLATELPLQKLYVVPEEVRAAIAAMPDLKRISTDSYDIRLCIENYFPHVTLAWTSCTTCAAEFPKVDGTQDEIWRIVYGSCKDESDD